MSLAKLNREQWLQSGAILQRGKGTCTIGQGPQQAVSPERAGAAGAPIWIQPNSFFSNVESDFWAYSETMDFEKTALSAALEPRAPVKVDWLEPQKDLFQQQFFTIQEAIAEDRLTKAVGYCFERASLTVTQSHLQGWLSRLLESDYSGYVFGHWNFDEGQGCLGLTPELLFETSISGELKTMALAGTAKDESHNLLTDAKEISEHDQVIQQILSELSSFGQVEVGKTEIWQPSQLRHLKTEISLKEREGSEVEILKALHPTPALGGAPKKEALKLLRNFDVDQPRLQFGAPFGVIIPESSQIVVQIRCLIWKDEQLFLGSGCGIVEASQLEQEWNELKIKRQSVKRMFGFCE